MRYLDTTHIAVNVPDLREAEAYYCDLFDLEVAWRDSEGPVSAFAAWDELDAAGVEPVVILLWRDALRLALSRPEAPVRSGNGTVDHIGVQVAEPQLRDVRERALAQGLAVSARRDDELFIFRDTYGLTWELDTRSYADPREIIRQKELRLNGEPERLS